MRRVLATAIIVAALGGFALLTGAAKDEGPEGKPIYWVQLDNAFGLIQGADFKVAGVRAGKITELRLTRVGDGYKALVGVQLTSPNVQRLRTDVTCESKPQSLIGEYFVDCNPGRSPTALKPGSTVPVDRTYSTIPTDLVNNTLRLPQRERLRIILNELGTGVAARGQDLNDVIRRAVPALRATDQLLKMLADENQTITELTVNADHVVTTLAANRAQLSRFIREARDTSAATADRRVAFRRQFQLLPTFLRQLRPTMVDLGRVADAQIPTLRDLDAASPNLKRFLNDLVPFAQASRPSIKSLGETANVGRFTIPPAQETVEQLGKFTEKTPELGQNLEIILEDLYDRDRSVERDPRSPNGEGWNGFEAILMYTYYQSQAINIFDRNGYILKVALYSQGDCNEYHNQSVKHEPDVYKQCASQLGPNQPGVFDPDPSNKDSPKFGDFPDDVNSSSAQAAQAEKEATILSEAGKAAGPAPQPGQDEGQQTQQGAPEKEGDSPQTPAPAVDISGSLDGLTGAAEDVADDAEAGAGAALPVGGDDGDDDDGKDGKGKRDRDGGAEELLDYLMRR
jgi:virulence factor Mce-like protein